MGVQTPKDGGTVLVHEWVTGGGLAGAPLPDSWAAEGAAMRRAIARDFASVPGVRVVVTLDGRFPAEPGPWDVVSIGPGSYHERFLDLAARVDYTVLIAPETDGILAGLTRTLERAGVNSLGPESGAVELTGDKPRLAARWKECGLPTPECRRVRPREGLPADFPYPAVLKPIDGAGSMNTYFVPNASALPDEGRGMEEALLQRWVRGDSMSASFLVGNGGVAERIGLGRQRVDQVERRFQYRGGIVPALDGVWDSSLERALAVVPGLRGFVGVDFLRDERTGRATLLEINPRPTTSYVGLAALLPPGLLAASWLETLTGKTSPTRHPLAALVHSRRPIEFRADGTILRHEGDQPHDGLA